MSRGSQFLGLYSRCWFPVAGLKFEANQFRSDDLADITKIFYFAYRFTFLPGGALRKFYVYIIVIMIFFGDLLQQRHHNRCCAAFADALALTCVPATFGAEY